MSALRCSSCPSCGTSLPYTCETCRGTGRMAMIRVGTKIARPESPCRECLGAGRLSQERAVALAALDAVPSARFGVMLGTPRYVAQARSIGDARVLALFDRLVAMVARRARERDGGAA